MSVVVAPAPLSGRRVRIDGLQGRPEFNGRSGVARRFDAAKGRYEVAVEGANFQMLLKPANLQLQDEADDAIFEGVRGLHVTDPDLGVKEEGEAADEDGAPSPAALSLACVGCARLPTEMGREKHPVCAKCRKQKLPTTYWCGLNCPGNPGAMQLHAAFHKEEKRQRKGREDGGLRQQWNREAAERDTRRAAQTGDKYDELLAEGARAGARHPPDARKAAKAYREAIALIPDDPSAYFCLGATLDDSGHDVEAAHWYLEAKERYPVGCMAWARATANAFDMLRLEVCAEVVKPEWWNDEGLKALSARVVRAAPNGLGPNCMRAFVLGGGERTGAWEVGPRSAAELNKAATHYERALVLSSAPVVKAHFAKCANRCRYQAEAMQAARM